jgi:hypothetical protein
MANVIFHGLSINYPPSEFDDPRPIEINFTDIVINYLASEFIDPRPIKSTFYGINIIGYTHPENIETTSEGATSKKVYLTNKGNIMINPNDTILIEI